MYNPQFDTYPVKIRARERMDGLTVLASAQIPIAREEARIFKEHAEHGILRPELVGNFQTTHFFRVASAYVIDDATNKQYDLFASKFVDLGNGVVYDTVTRLLWLGAVNSLGWRRSHYDAVKVCDNLRVAGLLGWRLPTEQELRRMYPVANNQEPNPFVVSERWRSYHTNVDGVQVAPTSGRASNYMYDYRYVWPVRGE